MGAALGANVPRGRVDDDILKKDFTRAKAGPGMVGGVGFEVGKGAIDWGHEDRQATGRVVKHSRRRLVHVGKQINIRQGKEAGWLCKGLVLRVTAHSECKALEWQEATQRKVVMRKAPAHVVLEMRLDRALACGLVWPRHWFLGDSDIAFDNCNESTIVAMTLLHFIVSGHITHVLESLSQY